MCCRYTQALVDYGIESAADLYSALEAEDIAGILDLLARHPNNAPPLHRNLLLRALRRAAEMKKFVGTSPMDVAFEPRMAVADLSVGGVEMHGRTTAMRLTFHTDVDVQGQLFSVKGNLRVLLVPHLCPPIRPRL